MRRNLCSNNLESKLFPLSWPWSKPGVIPLSVTLLSHVVKCFNICSWDSLFFSVLSNTWHCTLAKDNRYPGGGFFRRLMDEAMHTSATSLFTHVGPLHMSYKNDPCYNSWRSEFCRWPGTEENYIAKVTRNWKELYSKGDQDLMCSVLWNLQIQFYYEKVIPMVEAVVAL